MCYLDAAPSFSLVVVLSTRYTSSTFKQHHRSSIHECYQMLKAAPYLLAWSPAQQS
jgi:hypothetical protein